MPGTSVRSSHESGITLSAPAPAGECRYPSIVLVNGALGRSVLPGDPG